MRLAVETQMRRRRNHKILSLLRKPAAEKAERDDPSINSPPSATAFNYAYLEESASHTAGSSLDDPRSFPLWVDGIGPSSEESGTTIRTPSSSVSSLVSLLASNAAPMAAEEDAGLQITYGSLGYNDEEDVSVMECEEGEISYTLPPSCSPFKQAFQVPDDDRIIVVFDLDETLIEVNSVSTWPHRLLPLPTETIQIGWDEYFLSRRPGLTELLEWCEQRFHLVLWTLAQRSYAQKVLQLIDPNGKYFPAERRLFSDFNQNILSRSARPKDLLLLGHDMRRVVMLDNSWKNFEKQMIEVTINSLEGPIVKSAASNGILVRDFKASDLFKFGEDHYLDENRAIMEYLKAAGASHDVRHVSIQTWLAMR
jgi:hypothetical protein